MAYFKFFFRVYSCLGRLSTMRPQGPKNQAKGGGGFLERGQRAPPHQLRIRELGKCYKVTNSNCGSGAEH